MMLCFEGREQTLVGHHAVAIEGHRRNSATFANIDYTRTEPLNVDRARNIVLSAAPRIGYAPAIEPLASTLMHEDARVVQSEGRWIANGCR